MVRQTIKKLIKTIIMKKFLFIALASSVSINASFAQKYLSKTAHVRFFSETPMEKIEADNHQGTTVVDFEKKEMVFTVLMKSFEFDKALMQEHFNEKYVESATYPKATFKGKFTPKGELALVKDGSYPVTLEGTMELKGKVNPIKAEGVFKVEKGALSGTSKFMIIRLALVPLSMMSILVMTPMVRIPFGSN
jgi:polyisoprenoid-binding protein YceI